MSASPAEGEIHVVEMTVQPPLQRRDLPFDDLHRHRLLLGIAPVDVEPGLDARREQKWNAGLTADLRRVALGQLRHELHDAACGVAEKVDRILNLPGSH